MQASTPESSPDQTPPPQTALRNFLLTGCPSISPDEYEVAWAANRRSFRCRDDAGTFFALCEHYETSKGCSAEEAGAAISERFPELRFRTELASLEREVSNTTIEQLAVLSNVWTTFDVILRHYLVGRAFEAYAANNIHARLENTTEKIEELESRTRKAFESLSKMTEGIDKCLVTLLRSARESQMALGGVAHKLGESIKHLRDQATLRFDLTNLAELESLVVRLNQLINDRSFAHLAKFAVITNDSESSKLSQIPS